MTGKTGGKGQLLEGKFPREVHGKNIIWME